MTISPSPSPSSISMSECISDSIGDVTVDGGGSIMGECVLDNAEREGKESGGNKEKKAESLSRRAESEKEKDREWKKEIEEIKTIAKTIAKTHSIFHSEYSQEQNHQLPSIHFYYYYLHYLWF